MGFTEATEMAGGVLKPQSWPFWGWGSGFRFIDWGFGSRVLGSGFRVWGLGMSDQGLGLRAWVYGVWFRI